jgi:hypothetical protein
VGDAASVTSSSSSYSTVIRALPSRVYSPDSGLSPKRYEDILPSCSPSKNTKWSAREPNSTTPTEKSRLCSTSTPSERVKGGWLRRLFFLPHPCGFAGYLVPLFGR